MSITNNIFNNNCTFTLGELKYLIEDGVLSIKDKGKCLIESLPYNFPSINLIVSNKDSIWTLETEINLKSLLDYIESVEDVRTKIDYKRKKFNLFIIDKEVFDKNKNLIINNFI